MTVSILYYHSSIITIIKKQLLFSPRPVFLFPKTVWKAIRDPGVKGTDIRVWEKCRPRCPWIPAGGTGRFICHAKDTFMTCLYILYGRKGRFSKWPCTLFFVLIQGNRSVLTKNQLLSVHAFWGHNSHNLHIINYIKEYTR